MRSTAISFGAAGVIPQGSCDPSRVRATGPSDGIPRGTSARAHLVAARIYRGEPAFQVQSWVWTVEVGIGSLVDFNVKTVDLSNLTLVMAHPF